MAPQLLPSPIPVQMLLNPQQTESQRLELKATWDDLIRGAVVRTACAFANDLYNLNGGYIILGIEQDDRGLPVLPARGVDDLDLDRVQREVFGACAAIQPDYQPIPFVETYQERRLLILFCPGGDSRPYRAPVDRGKGERAYYVRQGVQTRIAEGETLRQLMEQASKIPWDDRRCPGASVLDISPTLVRRHLHLTGSHLATSPLPDEELYRKLRLVLPVNGHVEPRNVALLFFHNEPTRFYPGARIELCQFPEGRGGNRLIEHTFAGPLPEQIERCQAHLEELLGSITTKSATGSEAHRTNPYPLRALKELLANAVYHRGYDSLEPTKVYVEPDSIIISSYPGPHPKIQPEHFRPGSAIPEVAARNRRIGELLKELDLAEARGSGFLKVHDALAENGSPSIEVECDPTFFSVRVPIHWEFAIEAATELYRQRHRPAAQRTLDRALKRQPEALDLATASVKLACRQQDLATARRLLDLYLSVARDHAEATPILILIQELLRSQYGADLRLPLDPTPAPAAHDDVCRYLSQIRRYDSNGAKLYAAYFCWPVGELEEAIILLESVVADYMEGTGDILLLEAVSTLAGIRLDLAARSDPDVAEQLLAETEELLERVLADAPHRMLDRTTFSWQLAPAYLRLAQVRRALGAARPSIAAAVRTAHERAEIVGHDGVIALLHQQFPRSAGRRRAPSRSL